MKKKTKKKKPAYSININACGGKKGKGSCNWAGATIGITKLRIAA